MKVNGIANFINKSPFTQKILRGVSDNPAIWGTASAFVVGTTIRPALTMSITPNKQDAYYSAGSSVASSIVELVGGFALFTPMKKAIEQSSKNLYKTPNTIYESNSLLLRNYKSIANRVYKMFTFPLTSAVRFAMVPFIAVGLGKLGLHKGGKVKVSDIFTRIAKSNWGQKFYKGMCDPAKQGSYTRGLLTAETIVSTGCYMWATQRQKDIDDKSKLAMQIQHVTSCVASIGICTPINKKVQKVCEEVGKQLNPHIVDVHKVRAGLGILGPLAVVTLMNRCLLPAILTPISSVIRDKLKQKESINNQNTPKKLDLKA